MTTSVDVRNIGLRGVTVADSQVSFVDGQEGTLIYRGYTIQDLAQEAIFEEVIHLLLMGTLPGAGELEATRRALAEARALPDAVVAGLRARPADARPMDVLQSTVPALADHDPDLEVEQREAFVRSALRLIARTTTAVVAWLKIRSGEDPPEVHPELSVAADAMHGLLGREPTPDEVRLMDTLLVLHAEHTFNASTFAAREVASTMAHLYASVSSGVGALSGPLHGGANARVMQMLLEVGSEDRIEEWVTRRITSGQRVMGLGHAVYKTEDPRAAILREVARRALEGRDEERWLRLGLALEKEARRQLVERKGLDLYPNVDFYSSPVLYALGFPIDMFPAFFAMSRTSGWCAHVIEEHFAEAQPRTALYRPRAHYTGRFCGPDGCKWVPVEARGAGCPCGKELGGCDEAGAMSELA
jgi:citrate synthase